MGSYLVNPISMLGLAQQSAPNGTVLGPNVAALVPTSDGVAMIDAPANPADGTCFAVVDEDGDAATNPIILSGNGKNIDGDFSLTLETPGVEAMFLYDASTAEWNRVLPPRVLSDQQRSPFSREADLPAAISAADVNLSGTYAARPAPGVAGRIYSCTDVPYVYNDTGSAWLPRYCPFLTATAMPAPGDFTAIQAGGRTTTLETYAHGLKLFNSNGAIQDGRFFMKAPAVLGAPVDLKVRGLAMPNAASSAGWGLAFRDTTSGRIVVLRLAVNAGGLANIGVDNLTASDATAAPATFSVSSTPFACADGPMPPAGDTWLRIVDAGTGGNISFYYSADGVSWVLLYSVLRTTWLANGIGLYGLALMNAVGGVSTPSSLVVIDSWSDA